jgi:hypothetical protein
MHLESRDPVYGMAETSSELEIVEYTVVYLLGLESEIFFLVLYA